ncbi:MAG: hypothetical protein LC792_23550 [Actinobacteria bacterium]|nr:hypothetical protein [Actinomycetota bacterium]
MTRNRIRRAALAGATAAAGVLGAAGLAFACTASAGLRIGKVDPGSPDGGMRSEQAGPSGTTVGLVGDFFREGTPVEIRWDSAAGPELAEAPGPSFATRVVVPPAEPGAHAIVAVQRGPAGARDGDGGGPVVQRAVAFAVGTPTPAGFRSPYATGQGGASAGRLGSGSGTQMAVGAGLLGAGLVALAGGATAAVVRRRRVLAPAGRRSRS